jgi:hypothetical protein
MADSITVQMQRITEEYSKKVQEATQKACKKVSKELVQTLKGSSPKSPGGGEYASGWKVKQQDADTFVVYNGKKPGLTHLLEKSHVIANQYGQYGRSTPQPHIKPAADAAQEELLAEIEANL